MKGISIIMTGRIVASSHKFSGNTAPDCGVVLPISSDPTVQSSSV